MRPRRGRAGRIRDKLDDFSPADVGPDRTREFSDKSRPGNRDFKMQLFAHVRRINGDIIRDTGWPCVSSVPRCIKLPGGTRASGFVHETSGVSRASATVCRHKQTTRSIVHCATMEARSRSLVNGQARSPN